MERLETWAPVLICPSLAKAAGCEAMQALSHTCRLLRAAVAAQAPPFWQARNGALPRTDTRPDDLQSDHVVLLCRLPFRGSVQNSYMLPLGAKASYAAVAQLSHTRARVRCNLGSDQMAVGVLAQLGTPPAVLPLHPDFENWARLETGRHGPVLTLAAVEARCPVHHTMVSWTGDAVSKLLVTLCLCDLLGHQCTHIAPCFRVNLTWLPLCCS